MHAPFVFSSIQPHLPVAIAVLFYLEFTWGSALPPVSGGACQTLATVGCLPLSKHTGGGGATPAFSGWQCPSPLISGGAFPMTVTVVSFPHSKLAGWGVPLLPSSAGLFVYSSVGECPSPTLQSSGHPALFATCLFSFFRCLFIIQFVFFFSSLGGGQSVYGACWLSQGCLSEYCMLLICSPGGLHLPSRLGAGIWQHRSLPSFWFLCLTWGGEAMRGLGVWRCQSFASPWWFFLPGISPAISPRFYFRKHAFCFIPVVTILESPL
jgi:hypothetical protein